MLIELNDLVPDPLPEKIVEASGIWGGELRIEPRSKVLVSAQSGMGKSTLLHILYGLRQDYTGTAKVDGTCLRQFSPQEWERVRRERISLQFQDLRLFPNLSARENLLLPAANQSSRSFARRNGGTIGDDSLFESKSFDPFSRTTTTHGFGTNAS